MKKNNKISVVIPTYNGWETLKECISSIQKQTLKPFEIIVVDNASSDNTSQKVKAMFPEVKLITLTTNTGVTGGRNKGIEKSSSRSDFILFFDHDMVADRRMLEELVKILQSNKEIGITTPKIYYSDDKTRIWAAGTGINLWTGQILFRGGKDVGQYEIEKEVQVAPAVLLVKKSVINKLKSFDDRYFATYEDTDFCFRAKKIGFKVFYAPSAVAYHKIPSDPQKESVRLLSRAYWIGRNRILFMKDFGNNFYVFLLFLPIFIFYYLRLALKYNCLNAWFKFIHGIFAGILTSMMSRKIIFTGERSSIRDATGINIARYIFALKFCKHKKILELGCGVGYGTYYLIKGNPLNISAYDGDNKAIIYAEKHFANKRIDYNYCDIEKLKTYEKFNVIISFEVIEHLRKPSCLLKLAKRVLKQNGVFLVSTINRAFSAYDNGRPSNPYHFREYFADEFERLLKKYFSSVTLYGIVQKNNKTYRDEQNMRRSLRWRIASKIASQRVIRKFLHYLPENPKRLFTGEAKLSFNPQDFKLSAVSVEGAQYLYAICRF